MPPHNPSHIFGYQWFEMLCSNHGIPRALKRLTWVRCVSRARSFWINSKHPNRATLYLLYTSLCTGELNAIRKHKCFPCGPFHGKACRWAMLGELKPKGPKGDPLKGPTRAPKLGDWGGQQLVQFRPRMLRSESKELSILPPPPKSQRATRKSRLLGVNLR